MKTIALNINKKNVFNENNKGVYTWKNNSDNKAEISTLKNNRYSAINH